MEFSIGVMNCFGGWWRLWLCNMVNILSATELYTLEWLILCDINFTTHKNILMEHHSVCGMHYRCKLNPLLTYYFAWACCPGHLSSGSHFRLLALSNASLPVLPGTHVYTGFQTTKAWWCKPPYLLILQQLYYCRSVGKRVRGSRVGLSRRPGR